MTVREHLKELHKNASAHHSIKEAHHKSLATHYAKLAKMMGKAEGVDTAGVYEGISDEHAGLADHHRAQAEFHAGAMEECEKATVAELGKLVPDRISGVTPTAPFGSSVRAVPRTGQRDISTAKADVPLEFEHLVTVEDGLD